MLSNWERTGKIIKETFALATKDKDLYWPPILNAIVSFTLFTLAIIVLVLGSSVGWGEIPFLFWGLALVLVFLSFVATAFFGAALSWMTLEVVQGKDTHLGKGMSRAFKKSGSLLIYAVVSFVIMLFISQLRKSDGQQHFAVSIIKSIFAGMIEEAWDIAGNFLLPVIALTDKDFSGAIKELPSLLKHVPQALVGGFAFDFVVGWVYALEAIVCFLLLLVIGPWAILLFLLLALATYIFHSFVKSVYFTMLYLDMHPEMKRVSGQKKQ